MIWLIKCTDFDSDEKTDNHFISYNNKIPYIGNFSRGFNFRWVRDLNEIAKNKHSEK